MQLGRQDKAHEAYQRALEFTNKYLDLHPEDARKRELPDQTETKAPLIPPVLIPLERVRQRALNHHTHSTD